MLALALVPVGVLIIIVTCLICCKMSRSRSVEQIFFDLKPLNESQNQQSHETSTIVRPSDRTSVRFSPFVKNQPQQEQEAVSL